MRKLRQVLAQSLVVDQIRDAVAFWEADQVGRDSAIENGNRKHVTQDHGQQDQRLMKLIMRITEEMY